MHGLDTRRVETFTDIVVDKTLQNNKYMFICGDMIQIVDVVVNTGWLYYSNSVTIINRYTVKQQEFINSTMLDQLLKLDHSNWIKLLTGKESSWKDLMQYMILLSYHKQPLAQPITIDHAWKVLLFCPKLACEVYKIIGSVCDYTYIRGEWNHLQELNKTYDYYESVYSGACPWRPAPQTQCTIFIKCHPNMYTFIVHITKNTTIKALKQQILEQVNNMSLKSYNREKVIIYYGIHDHIRFRLISKVEAYVITCIINQ